VAVAKLFRAAVHSHDPSQSFVTVLHYTTEDASIHAADVANNFAGTITTGLKATLRTSGQLDDVTVTEILPHGTLTPPEQATHALNIAGVYVPANLNIDPALCGLVDLKTNVAGRGTHGWTYGFPILDVVQLSSSGHVIDASSPYWADMATLATGLLADVVVGSSHVTPVVFSAARWRRAEANYWFGITAATRSPKPRWLRKRSLIF
jgi:hypothetical protein